MGSKSRVGMDVRKEFQNAGFEVVEFDTSPETFKVKKENCSQVLSRNANGAWIPSEPPRFIIRGTECELEDRGYQKFWYQNGQRFPVRLTDLKTLHRFDQEVRAILGLKALYHESLGTTSARSVYDRLTGRPDQ